MALANDLSTSHSHHSQRVVYTSLLEYFGEQKAFSAVSLLDKACSGGVFKPIEFVNHLARIWSLDSDMKAIIRKELYRNTSPGAALKPLPERRGTRAKKSSGSSAGSVSYFPGIKDEDDRYVSDSAVVFRLTVHGLLKTAKSLYPNAYTDLVSCFREELDDVTLAREARAKFRLWDMRLEIPAEMPELNEAQMAAIVQGIYNAMCEAIGPADADRILTSVVQQVSAHEASLVFSPRRFL